MAYSRLNTITCGNLEIHGYSVAGEETVIAVPELNVCFDVGKAPEEILSIDHVLLSHGHMDHAAGIAYYCSQRDFREMAPGTVLLPARLLSEVQALLACWARIDGTHPPANFVPMEHGDEYELRRNLFAFAFSTNHTAGSLGFTIIERRQKLKPGFLDLPGPEIARLRKAGESVTYTINMPLITYLGDTMGGDFEQLACVRQSQVLIAECTFFDQDHHDRARAGRHYHFDQLAEVLAGMENEHVILTHLSRRTELKLARQLVREKLSPETAAKITFLMARQKPAHKKGAEDE
ncbi:MAG: MBL fold metallo-hydrolase [Sedimentisphaerales bacterium]|nr:MBL fold metallo-hydrolase [Sedimentisphaerales bacterium]